MKIFTSISPARVLSRLFSCGPFEKDSYSQRLAKFAKNTTFLSPVQEGMYTKYANREPEWKPPEMNNRKVEAFPDCDTMKNLAMSWLLTDFDDK